MQCKKEVSSDFCADAKNINKKSSTFLYLQKIIVEPKIITKIGSLWIKYTSTNNFGVAVIVLYTTKIWVALPL